MKKLSSAHKDKNGLPLPGGEIIKISPEIFSGFSGPGGRGEIQINGVNLTRDEVES